MDYSPWGREVSDTTEQLTHTRTHIPSAAQGSPHIPLWKLFFYVFCVAYVTWSRAPHGHVFIPGKPQQ